MHDHHAPTCTPTSFRLDSCACGFTARFLAAKDARHAAARTYVSTYAPAPTATSQRPLTLTSEEDMRAFLAALSERAQKVRPAP